MHTKMSYEQKSIDSDQKIRLRSAEIAAKAGGSQKRPTLVREKVFFFSGVPGNHKIF